jgi:hypothetical protein
MTSSAIGDLPATAETKLARAQRATAYLVAHLQARPSLIKKRRIRRRRRRSQILPYAA